MFTIPRACSRIADRVLPRSAMRRLVLIAGAAAAVLPSHQAFAHEFKVGDIEIEHPWSRATPPGATTGAGYLGLSNEGSQPDRLIGESSPIARKVEVHQMSVANGVMTMKPVAGGVEIPAGAKVKLSPGGYHMMLIGLTRPLVEGETIPVTLVFEKAGTVEVQLLVDKLGAKAPADDHDGD